MLRKGCLFRAAAAMKSAASAGRRVQSTATASEPLSHWDKQRLEKKIAAASVFAKDNKELLTLIFGAITVVYGVASTRAAAVSAQATADAAKETAAAAIVRAEATGKVAIAQAEANVNKRIGDLVMHSDYDGVQHLIREHKKELAKLEADLKAAKAQGGQ